MTNAGFLKAIDKNMGRLAFFGEDNLFISQYRGHEDNKNATVLVRLEHANDDDEAILELRRLLLSLKYKLEVHKGIEFDFELKKKAKND